MNFYKRLIKEKYLKKMNRTIAKIGALIVTVTVCLFAVCMLIPFDFGSYFGCLIMPMTGVFASMASGETSMGGVIALEFWCAYFLPVGILSTIHFSKNPR